MRLKKLAKDANSNPDGCQTVADTGKIVQACRARDAALRQSLSWTDYLRENHPEITSYLAATDCQP